MNQEDIIKMAREAGAGAMKTWNMRKESDPVTAYRFTEEAMERFAALVAAKAAQDEREACAKRCEEKSDYWLGLCNDTSDALQACAASLRARGR